MIDAVAAHVSLLEYKLAKLLIFFKWRQKLNFNVKFSNISALATNSNKKQNTHTHMHPHTSGLMVQYVPLSLCKLFYKLSLFYF